MLLINGSAKVLSSVASTAAPSGQLPVKLPSPGARTAFPPISSYAESADGDSSSAENSTLEIEEGIVDVHERLKPNATRTLLALITDNSLHIWSTKPSVEVCRLTRSSQSVHDLGSNVDVFWNPDSSALVILTSQSTLLFLALNYTPSPLLDLNPINSSQPVLPGPGEAYGVPNLVLELRRIVKWEGGRVFSDAIWVQKEHIVVLPTSESELAKAFYWDGTEAPEKDVNLLATGVFDSLTQSTTESDVVSTPQAAEYVVKQCFPSPRTDVSVWVTTSNIALLVVGNTKTIRSTRITLPSHLSTSEISCAAISTRRSYLALGLDCGAVVVYGSVLPTPSSSVNTTSPTSSATSLQSKALAPPNFLHIITPTTNMVPSSAEAQPRVTSLDFTPTGDCVCIGYSTGFAIYSTSGGCVFTSLAEEFRDPSSDFGNDPYINGVNEVWFLNGGLDLALLPTRRTKMDNVDIYVLPLLVSGVTNVYNSVEYQVSQQRKSSIVTDQHSRQLQVNEQKQDIVLCNSTSLFHYSRSRQTTSLDLIFDIHHLPSGYIASHFPIRICKTSPCSSYIVVAGRRGLCVYLTRHGRWKLFTETQEQRFSVKEVEFFNEYLLCGVYDYQLSCPALWVLDLNQNLDLNVLVGQGRLSANVVGMSRLFDHLLVVQSDDIINQFLIVKSSSESGKEAQLMLKPLRQIFLRTLLNIPSGATFSVALCPEDMTAFRTGTLEEASSSPILILRGHVLGVIESNEYDAEVDQPASQQKYRYRPFCDRVDWFNVSFSDTRQTNLRNSVWVSCGDQLRVWTNIIFDSTEQKSLIRRNNWRTRLFSDDPLVMTIKMNGVHPMDVVLYHGIAIGVEQNLNLRNNLGVVMYKCELKSQLLFHELVMNLLRLNMVDDAVAFAKTYQHLRYFSHGIEVMLHKIVEEEATKFATDSVPAVPIPRRKASRKTELKDDMAEVVEPIDDRLLPKTLVLLRAFPEHHLKVVSQCARKTEVSYWKYLFSVVGDVRDLFGRSLNEGMLDVATNYLVIAQTLTPQSISSRLAIDLLEKAFELEDFGVAKELIRFLCSIEGPASGSNLFSELTRILTSGANSTPFNFPEVSMENRAALLGQITMPDGTDLFYLEILVSKHARKLLQKQRIRALGKLASHLSFPLVDWLRRERNRSAVVTDYASALTSLHEQFNWPYPEDQASSWMQILKQSMTRKSRKHQARPPLSAQPSETGKFVKARKSIINISTGEESAYHNFSITSTKETSGARERERRRTWYGTEKVPETELTELDEIRMLARAMLKSECWSWVMLLSVMLVDVETLYKIFTTSDAASLTDSFLELMRGQSSKGYQRLGTQIEELLKSPVAPTSPGSLMDK